MKKHLLFTDVNSAGHWPIVLATRQSGIESIFMGGPLVTRARQVHLAARDASDFITPELLQTVQTETARVAAGLQEAIRAPGSKAGLESPMGEWLKRAGREFFQQVVANASEEIQALEIFEAMRAGARLEGMVVSDEPTPVERALLMAARRVGLPSFQLTRTLTSTITLHADHLLLPGTRFHDALAEAGFAPERLHVTGHPTWDRLKARESRPTSDEARLRLGLDRKRAVVCYLADANLSPQGAEQIILALLKACQSSVHAPQLVIQQDPRERAQQDPHTWSRLEENLRQWGHDAGYPIACFATEDSTDSVRAADVVVTTANARFIPEALLFDRPVIALSDRPERDCYLDEAVGVIPVTSDELSARLEELLSSADLRARLQKQRERTRETWSKTSEEPAETGIARLISDVTTRAERQRGRIMQTLKGRVRSRILMVAHDFFPFGKAGTERYTRDLSKALVDRGHDVRVFHPRPILPGPSDYRIEEDFVEGLPVTRLLLPTTIHRTTHLEFIKPAIHRVLSDHKIDIVHAQHLMGLGPSFIEAVKQAGLPFVLTANDFWSMCEQIHLMRPEGGVCSGPETIDKCAQCVRRRQGVPEQQLPRLFYLLADRHYTNKRALRAVDLVICPSKFLMETYQRHGFEGRQLVHLPQGAHLEAPLPRQRNSQGKTIFRYLGHVAYRKGLDLLVRAFNRVDATHAELHIHGINSEPRYLEQVLASVPKGKSVIYHGEYTPDQMPGILAETDVAVVPSRGENFPFVIREILHHRVPVIAASIAGIPEIIKDGVNGRLFPSEDHDRLRVLLEELCHQPEAIERLRAGIAPIKSMAEDAADIESLYREVQGETGHGEGINIVLVAPDPNAAVLAHREMADLVARGFHDVGVAAQVAINRVQPKAVNLLIGAQQLPSMDSLIGVRKIALEFDPLSRLTKEARLARLEHYRALDQVWCLHRADVDWYRAHGLVARVVPCGGAPLPNDQPTIAEDIDILVEGELNDRQVEIVRDLRSFCEVTHVKGARGALRNDLYRRAKIVLLLAREAHEEANAAELLPILHLGRFVLVEGTLPLELASTTPHTDRERLSDVARGYLADAKERRRCQLNARHWIETHRLGTMLREALLDAGTTPAKLDETRGLLALAR